jgi:hypothetical protein
MRECKLQTIRVSHYRNIGSQVFCTIKDSQYGNIELRVIRVLHCCNSRLSHTLSEFRIIATSDFRTIRVSYFQTLAKRAMEELDVGQASL